MSVLETGPLGESSSLLDSEPVCEPTLDDVAADSDGAGWYDLVLVGIASRRAFGDRSGDGDRVGLS